MSAWQAFKDGFGARWALDDGETPGDGRPHPRQSAALLAQQLQTALNASESELAEARQLIADLADELTTLKERLNEKRRGEADGAAAEKFRKLRRLVLKHVHPDRAGSDARLRAVLEHVCKDLIAEIEALGGN